MNSAPRQRRSWQRSLASVVALLAILGAANSAHAAVNISSGPTKNMSCSAGVCAPTAKNAVLNVTDLANLLQASDVKVTTGSGAVTIEVTAPFSWASANRLTLDANCNVSVKAPVTVAGPGGLSLVTNDGGTGCDLLFFPGGKVDFWDLSSSLVINGNGYALVGDIATLASDIAADPSRFYALARDYDATGDGTYASAPIATTFMGTFEALNHQISHLSISTKDDFDVGFFAHIGSTGRVRDAQLKHIEVLGNMPQLSSVLVVGSVAGENDGEIKSIVATGSVNATNTSGFGGGYFVGGLAGYSTGVVLGSLSRVDVDDQIYGSVAGGLVGLLEGDRSGIAAVESSSAEGSVINLGGNYGSTGGLVGSSFVATISKSHATGRVISSIYTFAGGLTGGNGGSIIDRSYATGNVVLEWRGEPGRPNCDNTWAGGLTGISDAESGHQAEIINSYALGSVSNRSTSCVGGFAGRGTSIRTSYSIGGVSSGPDSEVGGFVGIAPHHQSIIRGCYWDIDTSGTSQAAGNENYPAIVGLTDAQLKSALPAGFDPAVWGQNANINNGYPYLLANPPP